MESNVGQTIADVLVNQGLAFGIVVYLLINAPKWVASFQQAHRDGLAAIAGGMQAQAKSTADLGTEVSGLREDVKDNTRELVSLRSTLIQNGHRPH